MAGHSEQSGEVSLAHNDWQSGTPPPPDIVTDDPPPPEEEG
jgi:hypothetical protein